MEFVPPDTLVKSPRWTSELNFLGWQTFGKETSPELPSQAKVRISIQWREAHDPEFWRRGEDVYQEPLVNLGLRLVLQRDRSGNETAGG